MRVFISNSDYGDGKINFVDSNNVFVGYDLDSSCCEYADWFIEDRPVMENIDYSSLDRKSSYKDIDLSKYNFDKTYEESPDWENCLDGGGVVIFRLTDGKNEKFLHLFNAHNGYYGHGFEMKVGNQKLMEGYL
jgi:hypothetical protein